MIQKFSYAGTASVLNALDACWLNCAKFTRVTPEGETVEKFLPWQSEKPQKIDLDVGDEFELDTGMALRPYMFVNRGKGDIREDGLKDLENTLRMQLGRKLQGRRPA